MTIEEIGLKLAECCGNCNCSYTFDSWNFRCKKHDINIETAYVCNFYEPEILNEVAVVKAKKSCHADSCPYELNEMVLCEINCEYFR